MRLKHKVPCNKCPWRKASLAGWLGGYPAEYYADAVQANEVPACHLQDYGPDSPKTAMCVGALTTMANGCISAWKTEGGDDAKAIVGRRDDTFAHPTKFYEHHTDHPWVHPLMRGNREDANV